MKDCEIKKLAKLTERYTGTYKEMLFIEPSELVISFSQLIKIVSVYTRKPRKREC
jgi:hypothetical protein